MVRVLTLLFALAAGAGLSQFPEYAQQYTQRLAGAVDEMRLIVQRFDRTLAELGQTRSQAFAPNQNLSRREAKLLNNAKADIARLAFLERSLMRVQDASILRLMVTAPAIADRQIAQRAYADFKPAVPLTVEGLACTALGMILGWMVFGTFITILGWSFRRVAP